MVETGLLLLGFGFFHPEQDGMLAQFGVALDGRGNIKVGADRRANGPKIVAAGEAARGQSLVVWAMAEGRETARAIDWYLMGESSLPHSLPGAT